MNWIVPFILLLCAQPACNRSAEKSEKTAGSAALKSLKETVGEAGVKTPGPIRLQDAQAEPSRGTIRPRLLIFTKDDCLPCEIMHPWVEEIVKEQDGVVDITEINLDRSENRDTGRAQRIRSVPTQIYIGKDGEEAARHEGIAARDDMRRVLCRLAWISCATTAR